MFEVLGTVLLVDRPGIARYTTARRLRREGYVVIEAGHAREALDHLGRAESGGVGQIAGQQRDHARGEEADQTGQHRHRQR